MEGSAIKRFYRAADKKGYQDIIGENNDVLEHLALGKISLENGEKYSSQTNDYETALVILTGKAAVSAEGEKWESLGGRSSVFEDKATTVYVPCDSSFEVTAESDVQIAVCKAKADKKFAPFVIHPEDVILHERGEKSWQRDVKDILADNVEGRVQNIVLGETINKPGQWSGYPPHKHDGEFYPEEPELEEIYHYQLNPEQGFGVQFHYTKDGEIDDAYRVQQGDSFAIDKGYHPVAGAGGYEIYYLWFMAGPTGRKLYPYEDPDHKWVHGS
ncbi:5-deoxy-glucuronate isomerase [Alteribacillus sp. HJP-4]|uniref:5-deoxy-glucuronate isomerase n=1 Tax=Alteribacillus sp. HJP-4 TaxID=2775394 RepID=UPI0035CD0342